MKKDVDHFVVFTVDHIIMDELQELSHLVSGNSLSCHRIIDHHTGELEAEGILHKNIIVNSHLKLAIYASRVEEAVNEVRPALEEILADLGIPASSILVNVGETKYTKDEDIRNFNDLDVQGSQGNEKQFIILVDKGKEGWNCRSLFGVAMFRNPNSKIFGEYPKVCVNLQTDVR